MPPFGADLLIGLTSLVLMQIQAAPRVALWQADLAIRSLTVSRANGNLTASVVVTAESGEALGARVEVLLPVGVGIVTLGKGCVAGPSPTGIRELRSRVECTLGTMVEGARREVVVVTTMPPAGVVRGFAAVVMSDTPDPRQGNNFAERVLPKP
jgi:hypothetical protein